MTHYSLRGRLFYMKGLLLALMLGAAVASGAQAQRNIVDPFKWTLGEFVARNSAGTVQNVCVGFLMACASLQMTLEEDDPLWLACRLVLTTGGDELGAEMMAQARVRPNKTIVEFFLDYLSMKGRSL